jgi:hypothetical protein
MNLKQFFNQALKGHWLYRFLKSFKINNYQEDLCVLCKTNKAECVLNDEQLCAECISHYKQIKSKIKKEIKQNGK